MSSIYKSSQSHKYNIAKLFLGAFSSTVCCIHKAVLSTSLHITARTMLLWFVLFFLANVSSCFQVWKPGKYRVWGGAGGEVVVLQCFLVDQVSDHKLWFRTCDSCSFLPHRLFPYAALAFRPLRLMSHFMFFPTLESRHRDMMSCVDMHSQYNHAKLWEKFNETEYFLDG